MLSCSSRGRKGRLSRAETLSGNVAPELLDLHSFGQPGTRLIGRGSERSSVFEFLKSLDRPRPRVLQWTGVVVDSLQTTAFALNPHMPWISGVDDIAHAVYFTQFPIWDGASLSGGFLATACIHFVVVALLLAMAVAFLTKTLRVQEHITWASPFSHISHALAGFLFIPILQLTLSLMVCEGGSLFAFPGQECFSGLALASFICAFGTILLLLSLAWCMNTITFISDPFSKVVVSRAHSEVDLVALLHKLTTCVLMHYFLSQRMLGWFATYLATSCFLMGWCWAFSCPHYNLHVTFFRVLGNWLAAFFGVVAIVSDSTGEHYVRDMILVTVGGTLTIAVSYLLHGSRISGSFKRGMHNLLYNAVSGDRSFFPAGLPPEHHTEHIYQMLFPVELHEVPTFRNQKNRKKLGASQHLEALSFTVPFISRVILHTDCELACRFLLCFSHNTCLHPTTEMLKFATQLYLKGMVVFKNDGLVFLHMASFLYYFCGNEVASKTYLAILSRTVCSMSVRYQAYKLSELLKVGATFKEKYHGALSAHHDSLQRISEFWKSVADDSGETELALACVSNLASRSRHALSEYQLALKLDEGDRWLHRSEVGVVVHYGLFFEQVLKKQELADRCFTVAGEYIKLREANAMKGAKRNVGQDLGISHIPRMSDVNNSDRLKDDKKHALSAGVAISEGSRALNLVFLLLSLLLLGFMVLSIVTAVSRKYSADALASAAEVRTHAMHAAVLTEQTHRATPRTPLWESRREKLNGVVHDLAGAFGRMTWGKSQSTYEEIYALLKEPFVRYSVATTGHRGLLHHHINESLLTAGYKTIQALHTFVRTPEGAGDVYETITRNLPYVMTDFFDEALELYVDWLSSSTWKSGLALVIMYLCSATLVVVVFILLLVKFRAIERTKQTVRYLITLIPRDVAAKQHQATLAELRQFEDTKGHPEQLLIRRDDISEGTNARDDPLVANERAAADPRDRAKQVVWENDTVVGQHYSSMTLTFKLICILIIFLCIGEAALTAVNQQLNKDMTDYVNDNAEFISGIYSMLKLTEEMEVEAEKFLYRNDLASYKEYWERYHEMLTDRSSRRKLLRLVTPCCPPHLAQSLQRIFNFQEDVWTKDHFIAMRLVLTDRPDLRDHTLMKPIEMTTWDFGDRYHIENLPDRYVPPPPLRKLTNDSYDTSDRTQDPHDLARSFYYSRNARSVVQQEWIRIMRQSDVDTEKSVEDVAAEITRNGYIQIALCCVSALSILPMFPRRKSTALLHSTSLTLQGLLLLAVVIALAVFVYTYLLDEKKIFDQYREYKDCQESVTDAKKAVHNLWSTVADFVQFGDLQGYHQALTIHGALSKHQNKLSEFAGMVPSRTRVQAIDNLVVAWDEVLKLQHLDRVAIAITIRAFNIPLTYVPEYAQATWGESDLENIMQKDRYSFEHDPFRFHNETYDTAHREERPLRKIAQNVMFADWYHSHRVLFNNRLEESMQPVCEYFHNEMRRFESDAANSFVVQAVLCGLQVFVMLTMSLTGIRRVLQIVNVHTTGGSLRRLSNHNRQMEKMGLSLGFVLSLITVIFVLQFTKMDATSRDMEKLKLSSGRSWQVSNSMYFAEMYVHDERWREKHKVELKTSLESLRTFQQDLFFTSSGAGEDAVQDHLLFGPNPHIPSLYTCNSTMDDITRTELRSGVALAYERWMGYVQELVVIDDPSDANYTVARMRHLFTPLLDGLHLSTQRYHEKAQEHSDAENILVILVILASMGLVLLSFFLIFRPIMQQLVDDDNATTLLMQLLPAQVRELPEVVDVLEMGVRKDGNVVTVSDAVSNMSPYPVLLIDWSGTILRFSAPAVRECFGYSVSEVSGSNVKMLMPPEYASHHDQYLANYKRTGHKRVIDRTRIVKGMRKGGETFSAEVLVKELMCENGDNVFIGHIRDLTQALQLQSTTEMNETIQEMATSSILVINDLGTILKVNRAACTEFGFSESEMVGENVKMLMPSEVAQRHDSYLARYKDTGQKHIIGTTRKLQGHKKSGELISVELMVDEIAGVGGQGTVFVGFLRNITEDNNLGKQNEVNDIIANLSTIPVVVIDATGRILRFSFAAEKTFGYTFSKIKGKNVKLLMPPEYAKNHDHYLEVYRETRVKHIIGNSREALGRRASGQIFPIRITVAEVEKKGMDVVFVGYITDITKRKKFEREKETCTIVTEGSPVPIVVINVKGEVIRFSKMATQQLGYDQKEMLGHNVKMIMPPEVASKHDGYLLAYKETKVKKVIDRKLITSARRKDGSEYPIELRVKEVNLEDADAIFLGYLLSIEDQRELKRTYAINEAIMDISPVPIISINSVGIIKTYSRAATKAWGYESTEVVGRNVKMLMPHTVAVKHDFYLQKYRKTGEKHVLDTIRRVTALRKNGEYFPVDISIREVTTQGQESTFVGYAKDASTEEDMRKATDFGDQICAMSPVPLILIDDHGIVKTYNCACERELQYKDTEVLGKNVKMLMPPAIAEQHDRYLETYRRTGVKKVVDATRRLVAKRKDGTLLNCELSVCEVEVERMGAIKDLLFIGYLLNIEEALVLEEATKTVDVVVNLSTIPVIVIDSRGTILKFSKAAELVYQYKQEETTGKNVKMLMPDSIASQHDRYLMNYRRHGAKHVIDETRMFVARRKNGQIFNVEITIREVKKRGQESLYIGYTRDATEDTTILQSRKLVEAVCELSNEPIILIDEKGTILSFNQAATKVFGWTAEEAIGSNVTLIQPPEVARVHHTYIEAYLKSGTKKVIDKKRQLEGRHRSGELIHIELSVREILCSDGRRKFSGYLRDLHAEIKSRKTRMINNAVAQMAKDPLILIDHTGKILKVSESTMGTFQYSEDELINSNIKMLMPEEVARKHDHYLAQYLRTKVKKVIDTTRKVVAKKRSGERFPVRLAIKEIETDTQPRYVGYVADCTEEEQVMVNRNVAERAMDKSSVPIIQINTLGIVEKFNQAAEKEFQYDSSAIIGHNVKKLMPKTTADKHDGYLKRFRETRKKHVIDNTRQVTAMRANGQCFPVEISVKEVVLDNETQVFLGYVRDVTSAFVLQKVTAVNDAIISISPVPVIAITHRGHIFKFSAAAEAQFGYTTEEVKGKNVSLLMPEEVARKHDYYLRRYKSTGVKKVLDRVTTGFFGRRKGGELFPIALNIREVRKEGHETIFVGFARDYSEDIQQQDELAVSKAIQSASDMPIIVIDKSGHVVRFSHAACQTFGYTEEFAVGKKIESLVMPASTAVHHDSYIRRYLMTGEAKVVNLVRRVTAKKQNGKEFDVDIHVKELKFDYNHLFVAYVQDCSEEMELRMLVKLGELINNELDNPLVVITHQCIIQQFNRAAEVLFQFTAEQVIGRNVRILMPEETGIQHDGFVLQYLRTGRKKVIDKMRVLMAERKDGMQFKVKLCVKELKEEDDNPVFVGYLIPMKDDEQHPVSPRLVS